MSPFGVRTLRQGWPVRVVALGTAAYGIAITTKPEILARQCGLMTGGELPPAVAALTRSVGVPDLASGLALAAAAPGSAMSVLTAARVASDAADAIWLSRVAPPRLRAKVLAMTCGWAVVQTGVGVLANRRPTHDTNRAP